MSASRPLPEVVQAIAAKVEGNQDGAISFLRALVACKTESQNPDNPDFRSAALQCRALVADALRDLGCELHQWDTADGYPTLAARLPGTGKGRSLVLNGHIDVVPVGDTSAWSHDPWAGEIVDGKLYGRGATDMKGGVVAAVYALKALQDADQRPAGDVWFHIVSDEEVVGYGTRECIAKLPRP